MFIKDFENIPCECKFLGSTQKPLEQQDLGIVMVTNSYFLFSLVMMKGSGPSNTQDLGTVSHLLGLKRHFLPAMLRVPAIFVFPISVRAFLDLMFFISGRQKYFILERKLIIVHLWMTSESLFHWNFKIRIINLLMVIVLLIACECHSTFMVLWHDRNLTLESKSRCEEMFCYVLLCFYWRA